MQPKSRRSFEASPNLQAEIRKVPITYQVAAEGRVVRVLMLA